MRATHTGNGAGDERHARHVLRSAMALLWSSTDRHARQQLGCALGLVAGGAVLGALTPLALKLAIDALTDAGPRSLAPVPFVLVGLYAAGQYLSRAMTELRVRTFGEGEQQVRRRIACALFDHVVRLPLRAHLEHRVGAIGELVEQGLRGYQLALTHLVYTVLPVAVECLVVTVVLWRLEHAQYLIILGASAALYMLVFAHGAIDIRAPARQVSEHQVAARAVMTDALLNFETVKYFDAEPVVTAWYGAALAHTEAAWRCFFRRRALNGLAVATIFGGSLGTALLWTVADVRAGVMTVGGLVLVHTYIVRLVQPLEMLGYAVRDMSQGIAFLEQMLALLRERREGEPQRSSTPARRCPGELAFEHVSFAYGPQRPVLSDVSFHVPAGRTVAVVGASGAGKSSLIRLLFRLYEPDAGRILLDGEPIAHMPLSRLRQAIAVVPQDTVLFHDTIAKNIGFGRAGSQRWEIEQAARVASLHELISSLPEGYETLVGEHGLKLSGGERQRVAIARAALKRPCIFVFDEATSSLDTQTERAILDNLLDVSRRATTLCIAHRLSTVVHADEILLLDRGTLVERGTHAQLLRLDGRYARLWQAQQAHQTREAQQAHGLRRAGAP